MSAAPEIRPTFNLEAALSADVKSVALRSGGAEGENKYFTYDELAAMEQSAERALAFCRDATGRKFIRYCIAMARSHRNLIAAMVDRIADNDPTIDPF